MHHSEESALPRLIGVTEAADRLGLAKRTVYVLIASGRLECCRIGKRILIQATDLERFVHRHHSDREPERDDRQRRSP